MNWLQSFKLKKEANLLDSKLFILKTFLAISTAYLITSQVDFISKDMISVLFGLVLTLEPVNTMGIKNGLDQIFASFIGATATSLIILVFGVNPITIGASVAVTLYICLLINWKNVSVVALFTAIYMTQYLQLGANGEPSVLLTFELRFAALCSGVAVAIIYNYLFSMIQYRVISHKRMVYLFKCLLSNMAQTQDALETCESEDFQNVRRSLIDTSNNIEWVTSLFDNMNKEAKKQIRILPIQLATIEKTQMVIQHMRNIGHLMFDITYVLGEEKVKPDDLREISEDLSGYFSCIMDNMGSLKNQYEGKGAGKGNVLACQIESLKIHTSPIQNEYAARIERDLRDINKSLKHIAELNLVTK